MTPVDQPIPEFPRLLMQPKEFSVLEVVYVQFIELCHDFPEYFDVILHPDLGQIGYVTKMVLPNGEKRTLWVGAQIKPDGYEESIGIRNETGTHLVYDLRLESGPQIDSYYETTLAAAQIGPDNVSRALLGLFTNRLNGKLSRLSDTWGSTELSAREVLQMLNERRLERLSPSEETVSLVEFNELLLGRRMTALEFLEDMRRS